MKKFVSWENVDTPDNNNPAKNKDACFKVIVIRDTKAASIPAQANDPGRCFLHNERGSILEQ